MNNILIVLQIISGALLIGSVLIQSQGSGLGKAWGGGGEFYRSRRGVEKIVFRFTVFISVVFFVTSFLALII